MELLVNVVPRLPEHYQMPGSSFHSKESREYFKLNKFK